MCDDKRFKCPEKGCSAAYNKQFRLIIHRRKHTGERPFVCDIDGCSKSYTNKEHLKRHKCMIHEKACEVMCKVEGCGVVCNNKYTLQTHFNQIHNTATYAYTCAECSESFAKKRQLKRHILLHRKTQLKCCMCGIMSSTMHLYNKHKSCHKTYTCDCSEVFQQWSLFCNHRKTCTMKSIDHKCVICKKVFTTKTNLKQHSLTHLEESQLEAYRCSYIDCRRSYKYKHNLTYHIAAYHEKKYVKRIKCSIPGCDSILKSNKNLKQHLVNMHKNLSKKEKKRAPRKDKGKPKSCMTCFMSGMRLPIKEQVDIIKETNRQTSSTSESVVNCSNITGLNVTINRQHLAEGIEENIGKNPKNKVQAINCDLMENFKFCDVNFNIKHFEEVEQRLKQKFVSILVNLPPTLFNSESWV